MHPAVVCFAVAALSLGACAPATVVNADPPRVEVRYDQRIAAFKLPYFSPRARAQAQCPDEQQAVWLTSQYAGYPDSFTAIYACTPRRDLAQAGDDLDNFIEDFTADPIAPR